MAEAGLSSWFNLGVELLNFRLFKRRLRGKSNGEWTGADIKVVVSLQLHLAWTTLVAEKEPDKRNFRKLTKNRSLNYPALHIISFFFLSHFISSFWILRLFRDFALLCWLY